MLNVIGDTLMAGSSSPLFSATHAHSLIVPTLAPFPFKLLTFKQSWIPYFFQYPHLSLQSQALLCSGQLLVLAGRGKSTSGGPDSSTAPYPIPVTSTVLHCKEACVPWPQSQDLSTPSVHGHTPHMLHTPCPHPNNHLLTDLSTWNVT